MVIILTLDLNGEKKPLYQQIRDQIIIGLADGRLKPGDSLPSTRQLARDFQINFHTVNKAYEVLRQDGIVRISRKSGAIICVSQMNQQFLENWVEQMRIGLAEAHVHGLSHEEILTQCQSMLRQFTAPTSDSGQGIG